MALPIISQPQSVWENFVKKLAELLRRNEQQRARATEMIETARDMSARAVEMRKRSRLLLP